MNFVLQYQEKVVTEDIPGLSPEWRSKVSTAIETKLKTAPEAFGKPLRKSLRGYRTLRVHDYRVIFRIDKNTVKIFFITHRSIVYKEILKRL